MPADPLDAPHVAKLLPWIQKADAAIDSRIEDVRAHAERSLTRGVVDAAEGRSTWRMLRGQSSAKAAQKRLSGLMECLVGATDASLAGMIQSARSKFYRDAFPHWKDQIPEEVIDSKASPKSGGELRARGLVLFGMTARQELAPVFLSASNGLKTAMNAAATPNTNEKQLDAIFGGWEMKTKNAIKRKVKGMLSDSQIAIIAMVGRDMVKAEFRSKD